MIDLIHYIKEDFKLLEKEINDEMKETITIVRDNEQIKDLVGMKYIVFQPEKYAEYQHWNAGSNIGFKSDGAILLKFIVPMGEGTDDLDKMLYIAERHYRSRNIQTNDTPIRVVRIERKLILFADDNSNFGKYLLATFENIDGNK